MIAGVGADLVQLSAFAALLDEPGTVFAEWTFTAGERADAEARAARGSRRPVEHLGARFAAKEACVKALSQALAPGPLPRETADLREIEIVLDADARPALRLHGRVAALARQAGVTALHVSLSHEGDAALAFVVAERPL